MIKLLGIVLTLFLCAHGVQAQSRFLGERAALSPEVALVSFEGRIGVGVGMTGEGGGVEVSAGYARITVPGLYRDETFTTLAASVRVRLESPAEDARGGALIGPVVQRIAGSASNGSDLDAVGLVGVSLGAYGRVFQSRVVVVAPAFDATIAMRLSDSLSRPVVAAVVSLGLGIGDTSSFLLRLDPSLSLEGSGGSIQPGMTVGFVAGL